MKYGDMCEESMKKGAKKGAKHGAKKGYKEGLKQGVRSRPKPTDQDFGMGGNK